VTATIVAIAMWALCIVLLTRLRSRRDQSILLAASTIACSMTLNLDSVYFVVDGLAGASNLVLLLSDALLVFGVYFLARAILLGVDPSRAAAMTRPFGIALFATVVAMTVLFSLIDRGPTTGDFMQTHGAQAAASGYSAVEYLFIGSVMVLTSVNCLRAFRRMPALANRIGFFTLGVGAGLGVLLSVLILLFDYSHVFAPELDLGRRLGWLYGLLYSGGIVLMAAGLAFPPIGRQIAESRRNRRARQLRAALQPLWQRSAAAQYAAEMPARATEVERLRRTFIETQDALLRSPELVAGLQPHEQQALDVADQFFVRG
jgi:hypothetical protein